MRRWNVTPRGGARADLTDLYTFDRHAEAKLRAIAELWQTRRTQ